MPDDFQTAGVISEQGRGELPARFQRKQLSVMGAAPLASPTPVGGAGAVPASAPNMPNAAIPGTPKEPSKAAQFSQIAKQQEKILRERQAAKAQQAALAAKEQALAAREAKMAEFEAKRSNPVSWLEAGGHDYQNLTQTVLNQGELTAEQIAKNTQAELKAFREEQEARYQNEAKQQDVLRQQEEAQILESFQSEVSNFVETNSSEFELTSKMGQGSLVYETIDAHYQKTGELLPVRRASEMVESYLESEVKKAMAIPKVKSFFAPEPAPAPRLDQNQWRPRESVPVPATPAPRQPTRTLTNSSSAPVAPPRQSQQLSEDERVYRARMRLRGVQL